MIALLRDGLYTYVLWCQIASTTPFRLILIKFGNVSTFDAFRQSILYIGSYSTKWINGAEKRWMATKWHHWLRIVCYNLQQSPLHINSDVVFSSISSTENQYHPFWWSIHFYGVTCVCCAHATKTPNYFRFPFQKCLRIL